MFGGSGGNVVQAGGTNRSFTDRLIGAARLDRSVYEEVERDTTATQQAILVVVAAVAASAIGAIFTDLSAVIVSALVALVGFAVSAGFIYIVGTRIIPSDRVEADFGQVVRTLGFAYAPQLLLVLAFIPVLGVLVSLVVLIWTVITRVVAIQSALEASVGRAIAISIIASILSAIVQGILFAIFGVELPGATT